MKISGCKLCLARVPLIKPYVLSFVTVTHIDSLIVQIIAEGGHIGLAEAVPLPGYSHETKEDILRDLQWILPGVVGLGSEEVEPYLADCLPNSPFAVSAILTATEFAFERFLFPRRFDIPMVAPVSSEKDQDALVQKALHLYEHGYRTIKLKVGRDVEQDTVCALELLENMPNDTMIRIDANQGYSFEQACRFLDALVKHNIGRIECLEQPFAIDAWEEFRKLSNAYPDTVPMMLDESIVEESDIEKAAEYGADMIKLKLFKHRGISGLLSLVGQAEKMGLKIIFGNGVASEIGNMIEAVAFRNGDCFVGAFEGNGFCKLSKHILTSPPVVIAGDMRWEKPVAGGETMQLDENVVDKILEFGETV